MRQLSLIILITSLAGCAGNVKPSFNEQSTTEKIETANQNTTFPDVNFEGVEKKKKRTVTKMNKSYFGVESFDISLNGALESYVEVNLYERNAEQLVTDIPTALKMTVDVTRSSFFDKAGNLRFSKNKSQSGGEESDESSKSETKSNDDLFSISYKGTKAGFLDHLCFKTGCGWWIEDGIVKVSDKMKKTWDIPLLSGQQDIDAQLSNSSSSGGATGGAEGTSIRGSGGQSISSKINLDVYGSIKSAVESMLSEGGKLSLSESFGLLTVVDEKPVIDTIDGFLASVIEKMSIQVTFDVRILTVEKTNTDNRGISWNLLNDALGDFGISGQVNSLVPEDASSLSIALLDTPNEWNGSQAVVQSLSSQVDVIRENKYGGTTMNHTPLPIQVTRDAPFLNVTANPIENTNGQVVQSFEVIKETIGLSMSLLPVVNGDELFVHFNLTDSNLVETVTFDLGVNGSTEVPVKDSRNFIQRAKMKSGQTLVMTGFSQDIGRRTASSPIHHKSWLPFGSKNKTDQQTDLVIIITPRIIR